MTSVEMKYKFDIKVREILNALNHPFTTHEISRLLNESQLKYVLNQYERFEKEESVRKILSVLVKPYEVTTSTNGGFTQDNTNHTNGYWITLPLDMVDVLEESAVATKSGVAVDSLKVKPIALDEFTVNISNPFKKPYNKDSQNNLVWRLDRNDKHELITDGTIVLTSYSINYLQYPPDIDVDDTTNSCVLNASIHEEIIDGAIQLALGIIQRTASMFNNKNNNKE